jgi:hypothetical protein
MDWKTIGILFQAIPLKIGSLEFHSKPFNRREKHSELRNFVPNHFSEDRNAQNSSAKKNT